MNKVDDGGPAFPSNFTPSKDGSTWTTHENRGGMTLRDYFAAKAMQVVVEMAHRGGLHAEGTPGEWDLGDAARWAYELADAMLRAREGQ